MFYHRNETQKMQKTGKKSQWRLYDLVHYVMTVHKQINKESVDPFHQQKVRI